MCIWGIIHSIAHYKTFIKFNYPLILSGIGSTGHLLLLLLLSVCIVSLPYFRKRFYQFFLYFHYIFLVLFTIVLLVHGNLCYLKNDKKECLMSTSWMWLLIPLLYLCVYTMYKFTKRTKIISFLNCGNDIIELQLELPESYAGKTIWLCCPLISYLEWHPFTVGMYKNNKCYLYYKIRGDWTGKFYDMLVKERNLSVLIEGPYCTLPKNMLNIISKKQVVLISTGIGITPYVNLFQKILENDIHVYNLHIILIIRYDKEIQWLLPLIKQIYKKTNVNMKLYFTSNVPHYVLEYIEIPYIFGRPDFSDILRYNKVKNENTDIYYSGKTSVGRDIQKVCNKEKMYQFNYVN
jgi:NADPH oxidase